MGVFVQTHIISLYYALDRCPDIVMAGLNACGLQSKLLITPLSSEAIITRKRLSL